MNRYQTDLYGSKFNLFPSGCVIHTHPGFAGSPPILTNEGHFALDAFRKWPPVENIEIRFF